MARQTTPYRAPSIKPHAHVDSVSLDDFSTEEIREHLRHKGDLVAGTNDDDAEDGNTAGGLFIHPADLNCIATLLLCGQRESARETLCSLASKVIGRPV